MISLKFSDIILTSYKKPELNTPGVYMIKNDINGKFYIGSAKCLRHRFTSHKYTLTNQKNNSLGLLRAINKYGIKNFTLFVLETTTLDLLIEREQFYIDVLKPKYNMRKIAQSNLGMKHTEETKLKISLKLKGRKCSELQKETIGNRYRGLPKSQEVKDKISKTLMGHSYNKGTIKTKEWLSKISKTIKERYPKGSICGQAKPIYQYDILNNFIAEYHSIEKAAIDINIKAHQIRSFLQGKTKTGAGFIWKKIKI